MIGTLVAIIIGVFIYFSGAGPEALPNNPLLGGMMLAISFIMLFLSTIAWVAAWSPLQRAEQKLTSRISELYRKDSLLRLSRAFFVLFPLITVVFAADLWSTNLLNPRIILIVWLILFGISIDLIHQIFSHISGYLDPFRVVELYTHQANKCIQNEDELELTNWIDALAEVGVRSVQRTSISLTNTVCNELQHIARIFLESSKSISSGDVAQKQPGGGDKVSYLLYFILERLEIINDKAAELKLETVCSNIISVVGKIILAAAKYDLSLTGYPIRCLGKFAVIDQNKGLTEVGTKAVIILTEVAKSIINETDVTYAELQDPFFSLVAQMNEITKEIFRQDKMINLKLLSQPFRELKEIFSSEKMVNHPDTPAIVRKIDAVIAEYDALEAVMKSIPPIPNLASSS